MVASISPIDDMCNELDERLCQLAANACQYPRGSLERQRQLTQLVMLAQHSGKLWRGGTADLDDYEEALQETWLYICHNIETYEPARASVITWINSRLQWKLRHVTEKAIIERNRRMQPMPNADGEIHDPIDTLAAPEPTAAASPVVREIRRWVQRERATLLKIHVRDRPDINCQILILYRLPPAKTWEQLSQAFGGVAIQTLCNFYNRECKPRLRNFLDAEHLNG